MTSRLTVVVAIALFTVIPVSHTGAFELDEGFSGTGPFDVINTSAGMPRAWGDYNGNGVTDAADYTVWRDTLGTMGADLDADGDDGSGTGTSDGVVDIHDYNFWVANFGSSNRLSGFEAEGWQYSGIPTNEIGAFSSPGGTFDIAKDQAIGFILNPGTTPPGNIYQAQSGLLHPAAPIGGRIEYLVEYENFELATVSTDPNALNGVIGNTQHIITQMNFGNVNLNPGPLNVEFLDLQVAYDTALGTYSMAVAPIVDGVPSANNSIPDLEAAGFLAADEDLTALDWRVTIDSDAVHGGSTILVEFQINNSETFVDFFNFVFGTTPGVGIDGTDYPVDLAADGTTVLLNQLMLAQVFVDPAQPGTPQNPGQYEPHPYIVAPGLSLDRIYFTSPDGPAAGPLADGVVPEPSSLALLLLAVLACITRVRR